MTKRQPKGRSACGLRSLTSPRPNPAALAAPGSQSQAPCSFPCSPSPPRAAPRGFPEQNRVVMQSRAQSETPVPQSVAGAPLAGSMPPAPAERAPAAQASWATFARCRKRRYTGNGTAGKTDLRGRKARQGFWVRRQSSTGKNGL